MTTIVNLFLFEAPKNPPVHKDLVMMFPYKAADRAVLDDSCPQCTDPASFGARHGNLVLIQSSGPIYFEVNTPNEADRRASCLSPLMPAGERLVNFGEGWTVSVMAAEGLTLNEEREQLQQLLDETTESNLKTLSDLQAMGQDFEAS